MIQQIYITDYLSDAAANAAAVIEQLTRQCPRLLKADWQVISSPPLDALFNELRDGVPAIAEVAAVLHASHPTVSGQSLCLLPVHLGLQRDSFSLQGTLSLSSDAYLYLTDKLNQHFAQDFIVHPTPQQRFWWIQPLNALEVESPWPQACLYQQAFQWQPQGRHASLLRQWTNEIQMLLHQVSSEDDSPKLPAQLNSLWFASVPYTPVWQHDWQLVYGHGAVFDGLRAAQLPALKQRSMSEVFGQATIPDALMIVDQPDEVDWQTLSSALQKGTLPRLDIVLPLAERSVRVTYRKSDRWKFWRKTHTLQTLLEYLEASLPVSKLPDTA